MPDTPPQPKPGYKSTEFWVNLLLNFIALLELVLGQFTDNPKIGMVLTIAAAVKSFLGNSIYMVTRASVKNSVVASASAILKRKT